MRRPKAEIQQQIDLLKEIAVKETFRHVTMFRDSNDDAIAAQIEVLEERHTDDYCTDQEDSEEWTEHVATHAREAANWLAGDTEDKPADGWKGLY